MVDTSRTLSKGDRVREMTLSDLHIEPLDTRSDERIYQTAALLQSISMVFFPKSWPTVDAALDEVQQSLAPDRISLVAVSAERLVGWVGGIPQYEGHVYELHPLVVDIGFQRKGIGTALVKALEEEVADRGGITLYLGADDEYGKTSLSGRDLYPDALGNLRQIRNTGEHPYEFYMKIGFSLVGVMPDANGYGKPDIILAKRVRKR
jgi:aminoglycoside 6'-N-acetyltransferase I